MGPEETAKRLMEAAKAQLVDRPAVLLTLNLAMGAYGDAIRAAVAAEREACAKVVEEWESRGLSEDVDDLHFGGQRTEPDPAKIAAAIRVRGAK